MIAMGFVYDALKKEVFRLYFPHATYLFYTKKVRIDNDDADDGKNKALAHPLIVF